MDGKKHWLALDIPRSERAERAKSRSLGRHGDLGMTTLRNC